jgi:misacylated tRNA(Ala) deacylase
MTSDLLFREDAYLTQCEARITAIGEQGLELDRTVFYPHGGGPGGRRRHADDHAAGASS